MSTNYHLKTKYDITVEERDAIIKEQGGRCACCGRLFDALTRKEVDHIHYKVNAFRVTDGGMKYLGWKEGDGEKGWIAVADLKHVILHWRWAKTRKQAEKQARLDARRYSVRGVLCGGRYAGCNRKLGRIDNIPLLEARLAYLKNPPARKVIDFTPQA